MHQGTFPNTAKVGILVVAFLALLYSGIVFLGGHLFEAGKTYYVDIADASGLNVGTRVQLAGVKIGQVTKISLASLHEAKLTLRVEKNFDIPAGSTALVPGSLIGLGDTVLDIVPPAVAQGTLAPDSTILGARAGALDGLFPNSKDTMTELTATLAATRKLLEDGSLKSNVQAVLKNSQATLQRFGDLASQTKSMLVANQVNITAAVQNASSAMADIRKATAMAYGLLKDGRYQNQAQAILQNLGETSKKADHLVASLDAYVNDPKLHESLNTTLNNTRQMTEQGKTIAANMQVITKNGADASSRATELTDKAIALTSKATEVADEAKGLVQQLETLVAKVSGKIPGGSGTGVGSNLIPPITAEMDLLRDTRPNRYRTDVNFSTPLSKQTSVHFGIYDAFESNKFNLQLGQKILPSTTLRYGAYAGKEGIGVDYDLVPRFGLRGDLYDINNPRFDLRAKYGFGNGFQGWFGIDRLFEHNSFVFGVGYQK